MTEFTFGPPADDTETYSDGVSVPHRYQDVLLDGKKVGYVEIHMHRRRGRDGVLDVSYGFTGVVYGPIPEGGGS